MERLNPAKGKFLRVPATLGDGSKIEVGFGHITLSLTRLLGDAVEWHADRPINDTGRQGNPYIRWLSGHSALVPGLAADLYTGTDHMGTPQGATVAVARRFEPLVIQQLVHGEGRPQQRMANALTSFFGINSFGQDERSAYYDQYRTIAQRQFGKPYDQLTFQQMAWVARQIERAGPPPAASAQRAQRAVAASYERSEKLMRGINEVSRSRLAEFSHRLPSYRHSLSVRGLDVPLSAAMVRRYEGFLVEEYDRTVGSWNMARLRSGNAGARERFIIESLTASKVRAQRRLLLAG
jgi:hypothetical protein